MKVSKCLVVVLVAVVVVSGARNAKNFAGSMLGYGGCPNCGDSWYWTESGSIWLKELEEGKDFSVTGGSDNHTDIVIGSGLMICRKCLSNPDSLDANRIGDDLLDSEWKLEEVARAKQAVNAFKAGLNALPTAGVTGISI